MKSEALKRAQAKYQKKLAQVKFWVDRDTERDILDHLDQQPQKGQYIKKLIRKDMQKSGE